MARSLTIKAIDRRADRTYIRFGDSEIEIHGSTLADVRQWVREQFEESDEKLLALALACYFARDPDVLNPAQIVGRTVTLNLQGRVDLANGILRVQ
jgi:hypothetical protein